MNDSYEQMTSDISAAVARCDSDVEGIALASQYAARHGLKSGSVVPSYGRFEAVGDAARASRTAAIDRCYADVCRIIDREKAKADAAMSAPASADDVATVTLALSRESIGADELRALHARYAGSYQLARKIEERAFTDRVDLPHTSVVADADDAKQAARALYRRYDDGFAVAPIAESIAGRFHHIDAFGHRY